MAVTAIKPYMSIEATAAATGLSRHYLRTGCIEGTIEHVMSGNKYMINATKLFQQLGISIPVEDKK